MTVTPIRLTAPDLQVTAPRVPDPETHPRCEGCGTRLTVKDGHLPLPCGQAEDSLCGDCLTAHEFGCPICAREAAQAEERWT